MSPYVAAYPMNGLQLRGLLVGSVVQLLGWSSISGGMFQCQACFKKAKMGFGIRLSAFGKWQLLTCYNMLQL